MLALIGMSELLFLSLLFLVSVGAFVFWLWMLVDCVRNRALSDNERLIWVIVICLTHVLGALVYLLAGRRPRTVAPTVAAR
jgi:cytochrome c oxidase assembly factor CtaG